MHVLVVLCALGFLGASTRGNRLEYEDNYADNYDNEISQDQQGEKTTSTPCRAADFSYWDRLFIALEDSHLRQNMLLDSLGQCCGGVASLRTQLDKLARGMGPGSGLEPACRLQLEQVRLRLHQGFLELKEEGARRERNLNATVERLLRPSRQSWGGGAEGEMRGTGTGTGTGRASPLQQEQDATSLPDAAAVAEALVAIATELQTLHLRLSRVIEQVGTQRVDRGDT